MPDVLSSDTENATVIPVSEASNDRQFERFREYNTGTSRWFDDAGENIRRENDLHFFDAIAGAIEMTAYQKKRGRNIVETCNFDQFTGPGFTSDMFVWGICVWMVNEAEENGSRYWPRSNEKNKDEQIGEIADDLGMDTRKQTSVLQKVMANLEV